MGYGYSVRKVDNNHTKIRQELRREFGDYNVIDTHALPRFCDIAVGYQDRTYLFEVKNTKKDKLTPDEQIIKDNYKGHYSVITCSKDAIAEIYADNPPF